MSTMGCLVISSSHEWKQFTYLWRSVVQFTWNHLDDVMKLEPACTPAQGNLQVDHAWLSMHNRPKFVQDIMNVVAIEGNVSSNIGIDLLHNCGYQPDESLLNKQAWSSGSIMQQDGETLSYPRIGMLPIGINPVPGTSATEQETYFSWLPVVAGLQNNPIRFQQASTVTTNNTQIDIISDSTLSITHKGQIYGLHHVPDEWKIAGNHILGQSLCVPGTLDLLKELTLHRHGLPSNPRQSMCPCITPKHHTHVLIYSLTPSAVTYAAGEETVRCLILVPNAIVLFSMSALRMTLEPIRRYICGFLPQSSL